MRAPTSAKATKAIATVWGHCARGVEPNIIATNATAAIAYVT